MGLRVNIFSSNGKNEILEDLLKKSVEAPGLLPYILGKIAGAANVKIAQPGIFSGKVPGFGHRESGRTTYMHGYPFEPGDAKRIGLNAVFRSTSKSFQVGLWSPFANLFENFKKRPQVKILAAFGRELEGSGLITAIIERELENFSQGKIADLDKYVKRRGRKRRPK